MNCCHYFTDLIFLNIMTFIDTTNSFSILMLEQEYSEVWGRQSRRAFMQSANSEGLVYKLLSMGAAVPELQN